MIFEVPLADGSVVYMHGGESSDYTVVIVTTKLFFKIWDPLQRDHRSSDDWYVKKYNNASLCFAQFKEYPVFASPIAEIYEYTIGTRTLQLRDGTTRIQWLMDKGAQSFPVSCPHRHVDELTLLAGINTPELVRDILQR